MNKNLLDLNNDILNVIGDYVKKDNADRMEKLIKESFKQVDILYNILKRIGQIKKVTNYEKINCKLFLFT